MKLLLDTDLFVKLGLCGLLAPALQVLGLDIADCARLPALPHMLTRGKLVRAHGAGPLAALVPAANTMPAAPAARAAWLNQLAGIDNLDVGEAEIFAVAASAPGVLVGCGDKRAIRAVAPIGPVCDELAGRVICFEAVLLALCFAHGADVVRAALQPLAADGLVKICFSPNNAAPEDCLQSYLNGLEAEASPLLLWRPAMRVA